MTFILQIRKLNFRRYKFHVQGTTIAIADLALIQVCSWSSLPCPSVLHNSTFLVHGPLDWHAGSLWWCGVGSSPGRPFSLGQGTCLLNKSGERRRLACPSRREVPSNLENSMSVNVSQSALSSSGSCEFLGEAGAVCGSAFLTLSSPPGRRPGLIVALGLMCPVRSLPHISLLCPSV